MYAMTAAHPSLPLGTCVEVVNLNNGRHVFVRINDRGPYVAGRTIDLSYRAAQELRMVADGIAPVKIIHAKAEKCVRSREEAAVAPRNGRSGTIFANER
jgi:rare lipoprotein A